MDRRVRVVEQPAQDPTLGAERVGDQRMSGDREAAGVVAYDLLMSADRTAVGSLDALLQLAKRAAAGDHPLELVLLRLASEMKEDLFVHQQRTLSVTELETVGP